MKKNVNLILALTVCGIFLLASLGFLHGQQSGGIGGVRIAGAGDPTKPILNYNLEPILTVDLTQEIIEILPGGTNVLNSSMHPEGWRVGANSLFGVALGDKRDGISVTVAAKLLQLDQNGIVLDLRISDGRTKAVLSSQQLPLQNYQEAIIEFATSTTGNRRLAIRILPTIKVKEPLRDYPGMVGFFGTHSPGGFLILNGKEVLSRTGGGVTIDNPETDGQHFCAILSRSGLLVVSYRPFPGAAIKGYFQNRHLIFEWNGDVYEWASMDNMFLPEGQWAAYLWQALATPFDKPGMSLFACLPNQLQTRLDQMLKARKEREGK
jgi:hypothetical protein